MFRGTIVCATLAVVAQSGGSFGDPCQSCAFNVTALEEFSVDYTVVAFTDPTGWTNDAVYWETPIRVIKGPGDAVYWVNGGVKHHVPTCHMCGVDFCAEFLDVTDNYLGGLTDGSVFQCGLLSQIPGRTGFTTSPLPDTFPSEHGTIAVHARNLQLKLDSHAAFPTPFAIGPDGQYAVLSGMEIHEELHINGAAGQASFHLESPIVNLCFQLDHLPPVTQQQHDMIDGMLQQAEQIGPAFIQQHGVSGITVDGEQTVGLRLSPPGNEVGPAAAALFTEDTHPKFITAQIHGPQRSAMKFLLHPPPSDALLDRIAMKFDNYSSSVGNQFGVRACEIESQTATQTFLATNPEAREFLANRISQHQKRLQALLEPVGLNTRFNFIPLEIADLMIPAAAHCTTDELAEIPGKALTTLQVAAFSVCSFVIGVTATFAVLRKKKVTLADDYHHVSE